MSPDTADDAHAHDTAAGLIAACEATLLFLRAGRWDPRDHELWRRLTGSSTDPTSRGLCDFIRVQVEKARGETSGGK